MTTTITAGLRRLGLAIRAHLMSARRDPTELSRVVGFEGGDTVFALDRQVEPIIMHEIEAWPSALLPVMVVAEGLGPEGRRRFGPPTGDVRWHLLIDPIDGTRGLMYDKRSAWFLAAAAPGDGPAMLSRAVSAVMVELPTSKQGWADDLAADEEGGLTGCRVNLGSGHAVPLPISPSQRHDLLHGFGQVTSFFAGTHRQAADLTEAIAAALCAPRPGEATLFNDQYISTGGQMVELALGRDRFCCDLRPLFETIATRAAVPGATVPGLACHPYDVAGMLVARRAGVVLTDGFGRELDAPFDVTTSVHWCGYANQALRIRIEPIIQAWLRSHGIEPD